MSRAEDNVELVKTYLAARARGDLDEAFALLSDDVCQMLMFSMPDSPGIWRGKEELRGFVQHIRGLIPGGSKATIDHLWGSDDAVTVELHRVGTSHRGEEYRNRYCYVYEIADGKIHTIREYTDSYYARSVLA